MSMSCRIDVQFQLGFAVVHSSELQTPHIRRVPVFLMRSLLLHAGGQWFEVPLYGSGLLDIALPMLT